MNTHQQKTTYNTDEAVESLLKDTAWEIKPNKDALRTLLASLPQATPSPYAHRRVFFTHFQKISVAVFAVVVLVSSGTWLVFRNSTPQLAQTSTPTLSSTPVDATQVTSPTDTSDAALSSDIKNIDTQMQGLDSDVTNANVD